MEILSFDMFAIRWLKISANCLTFVLLGVDGVLETLVLCIPSGCFNDFLHFFLHASLEQLIKTCGDGMLWADSECSVPAIKSLRSSVSMDVLEITPLGSM